MENSINYQLENENLKLKIELCKKELELKEKEIMLKEKELLLKDKELEFYRITKDKEPTETKEEPIETEADDFKNTKEVKELYHVEPKKADEKEPKKLILMKDKVKKTFGINENVILEPHIKPKITLVNSSPKNILNNINLILCHNILKTKLLIIEAL